MRGEGDVQGLTLGKHRRFLQEVIEAFQEAGYVVEADYRVLNARRFRRAMGRKRSQGRAPAP